MNMRNFLAALAGLGIFIGFVLIAIAFYLAMRHCPEAFGGILFVTFAFVFMSLGVQTWGKK
jgi:hypothetical protein